MALGGRLADHVPLLRSFVVNWATESRRGESLMETGGEFTDGR